MQRTTHRPRLLTRPGVVALAAAVALTAGACAKSEDDASKDTQSPAAAGAEQKVVTPKPGSKTCAIDAYGAEKLDLKNATVGFSQSEKEANPFRIAETQSIKDEAKKRGVKLLTANAQSQFSKQISDVQDLLAKGADLLVIAPLNSDGWDPVLQAAAAKKVPIVTIDRKINATACKDYVSFIASDFVEQGRRAADQMIEATGGKGEVAILLGSAGNNVTTERTKGFKERIAEKAPELKVVFEQTGDFAREKGQQVTEQLIQSKPGIKGIYAENDEMGLGAVAALKGAGKKAGDVKIVTVDGTRNAVQGIVDGWISGVIESNPRFGPLAFQTLDTFTKGEEVPQDVIIQDSAYDADNAKTEIAKAY
ncbi:LacI family transcriptional regulator [Streptomyces sp. WAC 01325]|uniref:ABC transporter substrate-binding protein n=1 Tax=Streptomyces chartreusis TaxID=1969 RepID=A0A7H8TMF2_STRCX|nr:MULTISPECIES: ABC transporter substrate-binding protein [Streptomyces]MBT1094433.1 ABC transporter substrate-binding protein [Streptomyces sp. Tu102]QEV72660.1 ABC transporter substrate-binding protein [Streptomyces chartreusis]QKZ24112.1 ABC transporter substrate-binding protein [Streptomyces chartreusis]RSN10226.1 LacI family transcriptional regulator [Streptomyces sp. WAC 01325]RSO07720.1 LacI family transcriptional regulator [Streptomyces sp. WAC 05379]